MVICVFQCILYLQPHEDGDLYYPTVSTITLGSHTLLDFYHRLDSGGGETGKEAAETSGNGVMEQVHMVLVFWIKEEGIEKQLMTHDLFTVAISVLHSTTL